MCQVVLYVCIHFIKVMENIQNSDEIFDIANSIVHHLNHINFNKMAQKMISLPIDTIDLFEKIATLIYSQVLSRYNFTVLYAKLCACMIKNSKSNKVNNSETTFKKVLALKSFEVFTSFNTEQPNLKKLKEEFRCGIIKSPKIFKRNLNILYFNNYNKALFNCKFIGVLFKEGAFSKKVIVSCIDELLKEKNDLKIHCLSILLILTGPKLSKTYDLSDVIDQILQFKNENSEVIEISPILKHLILEVQDLHLNGWINYEHGQYIENNMDHYLLFERLPIKLKKPYELKSYTLMAKCIYEECYEVLFFYVNKNDIREVVRLLNNINSWIRHEQISFVVSVILVALNENQNIRFDAGKLLDDLVKEKWLLSRSIQFGIDKILDDSEINTEFPNISYLVSDITGKFTF